MADNNNISSPLSPNEALDQMGKFLDLATKRGAFNLLETEQIIRAISVFRTPSQTSPSNNNQTPPSKQSNDTVTI